MEYRGFHSIAEYETECARVGFSTRRVPFYKDGKIYFALITSPPKSGSGVEAWALFDTEETVLILDGIISGGLMDPAKYMRNGLDMNYLGKLAAHGYSPGSSQAVPS